MLFNDRANLRKQKIVLVYENAYEKDSFFSFIMSFVRVSAERIAYGPVWFQRGRAGSFSSGQE